jgi:hypothetical protein
VTVARPWPWVVWPRDNRSFIVLLRSSLRSFTINRSITKARRLSSPQISQLPVVIMGNLESKVRFSLKVSLSLIKFSLIVPRSGLRSENYSRCVSLQ